MMTSTGERPSVAIASPQSGGGLQGSLGLGLEVRQPEAIAAGPQVDLRHCRLLSVGLVISVSGNYSGNVKPDLSKHYSLILRFVGNSGRVIMARVSNDCSAGGKNDEY